MRRVEFGISAAERYSDLMDMAKAGRIDSKRFEYGNYREFPVTDAQGLTFTTSVIEVEPKGALETPIRHFTDSQER